MTQPTRPPKSAPVTERSGVIEGGAGGTSPRHKRATGAKSVRREVVAKTTHPKSAGGYLSAPKSRCPERTAARANEGERSEPESCSVGCFQSRSAFALIAARPKG